MSDLETALRKAAVDLGRAQMRSVAGTSVVCWPRRGPLATNARWDNGLIDPTLEPVV